MQALHIAQLKRALDGNYVLVLTTNSNERKAVASVLENPAKANIQFDNDGARLGLCGEQLILHITGTSGGQATKSVGRIARHILSDPQMPKPMAVILVGIAWGSPQVCSVGDVVLSGEILAINQLRFEGSKLHYKSISRYSPWFSELPDIGTELAESLEKSKVGVLASGEQFLADDRVRDELLAAFPQVIGGEMEAWDLVPDLKEIPWAQLRGICDFAETELNRSYQECAAAAAACLLAPLIASLCERGLLSKMRRDPATVGLLEVLAGDAIHITEPQDGMHLDSHLNYRIGPSLVWRVAQYGLGAPPTANLPRLLTDLLLEMAQNAIKHGGASRAEIKFGDRCLIYSDNGRPFDLFALSTSSSGRGGREALAKVTAYLIEGGFIEISKETKKESESAPNRYQITFPMLSLEMRMAREKCSIEIPFGGASGADQSEQIVYDPACEKVFFDASELMMYSRRFDVLDGLQAILDGGRDIIIKCDDAREKAFYEDSLSVPNGRDLIVVVAPAPLFNGG